jgi:hypothetical protein
MNKDLIDDTQALLGGHADANGTTRRFALKAAIGVGYAAAAMPIIAQTAVKTPVTGLVTGEVTIDVNGFKMPAYRSAPAGKSDSPVVLVISEIFGVHEYIADVTHRLAQAGYMAIAPELFVRQGDPSEYGELAKLQSEIIAKVPDAQVMADLDSKIGHYWLLLGWPHYLAVCRASAPTQGGCGLVRPLGRQHNSANASASLDIGQSTQSPRARLVWRSRYWHSLRHG